MRDKTFVTFFTNVLNQCGATTGADVVVVVAVAIVVVVVAVVAGTCCRSISFFDFLYSVDLIPR